MSTAEYTAGLAANPAFARPRVHRTVVDASVELLSNGAILGVGVALVVMARRERHERARDPKAHLTLEAIDARLNRVRDVQIRRDLVTGAIGVVLALATILAYRPSNEEMVVTALRAYLRRSGGVSEEFDAILRNVAPYRIESVGL